MEDNGLFWKDNYHILEKYDEEIQECINILCFEPIHEKYKKISLNCFCVKYAFRTLNEMIEMNDLEKVKEYYKEDLDEGSWTIDVVEDSSEVEEYFKNRTLPEFYYECLEFLEEWEESERHQ